MTPRRITTIERQTGPQRWWFFRRRPATRLAATRELLSMAGESPEADTALQRVWKAALSEPMAVQLHMIIQAAPGLDQETWAARLVEILDRTPSEDEGIDLRNGAVAALKQMGRAALPSLTARLLLPGEEGAHWTLFAAREIGLYMLSDCICESYMGADKNTREHLVRRLASIKDESWSDLAVLLAGLCKRPPSGGILAAAIINLLDRESVERSCVDLWTRHRLRAAKEVLAHSFGYGEEALK